MGRLAPTKERPRASSGDGELTHIEAAPGAPVALCGVPFRVDARVIPWEAPVTPDDCVVCQELAHSMPRRWWPWP